MWSHQYDQQVNQVECSASEERPWNTNGPESNLFGVEPNYGCCTANLSQGWPKFAAHLWMEPTGTADYGGLAALAYAPSEARFQSKDVPVTVALDTDYPFRETLTLTVTPDRPVSFPLLLRVPEWAQSPSIKVAGESLVYMIPGSFHRLDRTWQEPTTIEMRFPMRSQVSTRYHGALAVERGPLAYSLALEEAWTRVNADKPHRELPHGDFEVRPASAWNYGLLLDPESPELDFEERPVGERPFSPEGAGMQATVSGRRLPDWKLQHGWAGEIVPGLQNSDEPLEKLRLIPYGCTNIRITEFPGLRS
jgi:hypothetical protein